VSFRKPITWRLMVKLSETMQAGVLGTQHPMQPRAENNGKEM